MTALLETLRGRFGVVLRTETATVGAGELVAAVTELADRLRQAGHRRVALWADNGPAWAAIDLASLEAGICLIPLPSFFSAEQLQHILRTAEVDLLLAQAAVPLPQLGLTGATQRLDVLGESFAAVNLGMPTATTDAKITFTSGTTGRPKGVRLSAETMLQVADGLVSVLAPLGIERHLCALPLPTLLENLAGLYVPLLAEAEVVLPSLAELGYSGAGGLQIDRFLDCLDRYQPQSLILVPQLLQAMTVAAEHGLAVPHSLRFVAVGGATVSPALLRRARAVGIPAYEGYGLSECSSVVCLNLPGAERPGTVGRPLPHCEVQVLDDGEIAVRGAAYSGYLGEPPVAGNDWIRTGDVGQFDDDGFLRVTGRRKHVFITSYGRNVSPEWVESELTAEPAILQVAVFGEARPTNVAIVTSLVADTDVDAAVQRANGRLPEYARIGAWIRAGAPFTPANGQLTGNGRLRREAILAAYQSELDRLFDQGSEACSSTTN